MSRSAVRIPLVGDLTPFITTQARVAAFSALGVPIEAIDIRRCIESGYFEINRVREILPFVEERIRERS